MVRIFFVLLTVSSLAAVVYAAFAHDLAAARARLVGRSKTVETSFGTLEYAEMGEGPPILVVHGAEGGFDQGIDMTGALAGRGYRLIAPSRFGYLRSTMPGKPTTAMQANAYAQLLDRLGIGKAAAVRFSAGALVGAMVNSDFAGWAVLKLMTITPGVMTGMMLGTDGALVRAAEPSEKARLRQALEHILPISPRIAGMNFDVKTAATREPDPVEKITCPVLTI